MIKIGIVKRFNKIKGYGFILPIDETEEIFVHFTEIKTDGYKELKEGQRVHYVLETGEKGRFATQVQLIP